MLRENQYILRQVNIALDLLLVALAFAIAHGIRSLLSIYIAPDLIKPAELANYYRFVPVAAVITVAALAYNSVYHSQRVRTRTRELARRMALGCVEAVMLLAAFDYLVGEPFRPEGVERISRALILLLAPISFAVLLFKAWALRRILTAIRRRGYNYRRVILVGSGPPLEEFVHLIRQHPIWGLMIEGLVTDRPELQGEAFAPEKAVEAQALQIEALADLSRAPVVLWRTPVDEVVFVPSASTLTELRPLMEICEEMGVRTHLPLNFFHAQIARPVVDRFEDIAVLSYWPTRLIGPALLFKYAFDRVAALLMLIIFSPVMLVAALAIRLTSRRGEPVLFRQTRCGLNGRLFTLYKFRSMRVDAEQRRSELEELNEAAGPVFKMQRDPRVTAVGRLLRKFSIDELPQLWNVLKGEMSLVGPRPPLPSEVTQYDRWQRRRLSMKPGITCIWQVSGRNRIEFEQWMKLDLQYIDNWSLMMDFKILARTVYVVVTGYGAM